MDRVIVLFAIGIGISLLATIVGVLRRCITGSQGKPPHQYWM